MLLRKSLRCWTNEKIPGFHFIEESKRYYPKDNLAAQVIGFVGIDDKGLEGVEASMDTYLRGVKEKQTNYTDAKGNLIGPSGLNESRSSGRILYS